MTTIDIINTATALATLVALGFTIYQARLSEKALLDTRKSIEQEKINRQLSLLPKYEWIIQVNAELRIWQETLEENSRKLNEAINNQDESILKSLSEFRIKKPNDLNLSINQYKEMPNWLSQIWISGAQCYYHGLGSMLYLYKDEKPNYTLAKLLITNCNEMSSSLATLREYISDMIPDVILNTPASVNSREFFRD